MGRPKRGGRTANSTSIFKGDNLLSKQKLCWVPDPSFGGVGMRSVVSDSKCGSVNLRVSRGPLSRTKHSVVSSKCGHCRLVVQIGAGQPECLAQRAPFSTFSKSLQLLLFLPLSPSSSIWGAQKRVMGLDGVQSRPISNMPLHYTNDLELKLLEKKEGKKNTLAFSALPRKQEINLPLILE